MTATRRDFLKTSSAAAMAVGLGVRTPERVGTPPVASSAGDPAFREIALRAIDAARSAGADYADARVTYRRTESLGITMGRWRKDLAIGKGRHVSREEELGLGLRVSVNGAWGFVATRGVTHESAAHMARAAVVQARANAWGESRRLLLAPTGKVNDGTWVTPIKRDPFDVSIEEKQQYMTHLSSLVLAIPDMVQAQADVRSRRQEKTFASSEGSIFVQTTYECQPGFHVNAFDPTNRISGWATHSADLTPTGLGFEGFSEARLEDQIPRLAEEARRKLRNPPQFTSVDIGRYDIVLDARGVAGILADSIGGATELDRALGYEANARGTSYLSPPEDILGKFRLGPEILNVKADRSQPTSLSRVKWDDEGVEPEDFFLVGNGIVADYQTTREQAPWLEEWYRGQGVPVRSHGCSGSESAFFIPMQHRPNISLLPGPDDVGFDELIASTKKGLAFVGFGGLGDQQLLNWQLGSEVVYEIRDGKLGRRVGDAGVLTRSPEFWRSLVAIGGPRSYKLGGGYSSKGQPDQSSSFSVGAVPAKFRNATVINTATLTPARPA